MVGRVSFDDFSFLEVLWGGRKEGRKEGGRFSFYVIMIGGLGDLFVFGVFGFVIYCYILDCQPRETTFCGLHLWEATACFGAPVHIFPEKIVIGSSSLLDW